MNFMSILLTAILYISLFSGPAAAQIYKWVDESGVTHFSDTPPQGQGPDRIDVQKPENPGGHAPALDFDLSGEVRDPAGNPLKDVEVTIIEHHHQPPGHYEFKTVHRKKQIHQTFRIACADCPIHSLYFRKKGFFPKKIQIKATPDEKKLINAMFTDWVMTGKPPLTSAPFSIVRKDMVVVLDPLGNAVRLLRIEAQLAVSRSGDLMSLKDIPDRLRAQGLGNKLSEDHEKDLDDLVIRLETDSGAYPAAEEAMRSGRYGRDGGIGVYLAFTGTEGGIIKAQPSGTRVRENLKAMQNAPERGYKKRLELIPNTSSGSTYFYFRSGTVFGKGTAAPLMFSSDLKGNPAFFSHVELYLNPHGNTNLRGR